jgi:hypothetical protein
MRVIMLIFILAFIVVFCAGLGIREVTKGKEAPSPVPPPVSVYPTLPPNVLQGATGLYCRSCGTRSYTGDSFCRTCGNKIY